MPRAAVAQRQIDRSLGESHPGEIATIDMLEEFGEGELWGRRLTAESASARDDRDQEDDQGRNIDARPTKERWNH